jgi:hypothetical protein
LNIWELPDPKKGKGREVGVIQNIEKTLSGTSLEISSHAMRIVG